MGGGLSEFMADAGFEGKADETLPVPVSGLGAKAAVLVGLGERQKVTLEGLRRAAAAVVRRGSKAKVVATSLLDAAPADVSREAAAQAIAEGAALGAYRFLRYKQKGEAPAVEQVLVLGKRDPGVQAALERGAAVARAVAWARDLVNEPAGALTPSVLAEEAQRAADLGGLSLEVLDEVAIANEGLGGLLGVSLGSEQPGHGGAGRQGHHLRLGRPLHQAGRGYGDDEDGHVGGGRGHRGDVGAAGSRRTGQGHRLRAGHREHARRGSHQAG
jgi:leucyl aminopeptidase